MSRGLVEPSAVGDVRKRPVDIGGSAYVPLSIPQKLTEELTTLAAKAAQIEEPFEQSLFLMAFISWAGQAGRLTSTSSRRWRLPSRAEHPCLPERGVRLPCGGWTRHPRLD